MDGKIAKIQPNKPDESLTKTSSLEYASSTDTKRTRPKKARKACHACRKYKTRCVGQPCKRCKDTGSLCNNDAKKLEKSILEGYIKSLEKNQSALTAAIRQLYAMIRRGDEWQAGDPELNDRGEPAIHDIVSRLGCMNAGVEAESLLHQYLLKERTLPATQQECIEASAIQDGPLAQRAGHAGDGTDLLGYYQFNTRHDGRNGVPQETFNIMITLPDQPGPVNGFFLDSVVPFPSAWMLNGATYGPIGSRELMTSL
ncbi:hypothetical protein F5B19DRAFT_323779 [Rostrohypoxylon terebratum]|nr:hypothetical protein F5B19DRAFT_323779 [Rostrohypoxylon terebratum]